MTSDCPTAEFVGSSWRRDQHARRGSQHCMHCHSAVNARDCTSSHCHSTSNTRAARPHTATRRRTYRNGTLRAEWQCRPRGAARPGPSGSATHTATRRRAYGLHALTLPLDVERTETVRSGPSGSAGHAGLHAQGRVAVPPTLPLDVERTETVRPGPSGSADHAGLHAQGRVAVPPTLPLDVERTGCTPLHCHSTSNVPKRYAQARVAVRVRVASGPAVAAPMPGRTSRTCLERVGLGPCSRQTLCGQWNVFLQGRSGWLCSWPARCSQPPLGGTTVPRCTTPHASAGHCPCHNACRPSRRASRAGTSPPTPHPRAHSSRTPRSPRGPRCSLCALCPRVRLHRCTPR